MGAGKGICALREEGHGSRNVMNSHCFVDDTTSEKLGGDHLRLSNSKRQRSDLNAPVTSGTPSRCVMEFLSNDFTKAFIFLNTWSALQETEGGDTWKLPQSLKMVLTEPFSLLPFQNSCIKIKDLRHEPFYSYQPK